MNLEPIDTSTTAGKVEVMRLSAEGRAVAKKADNDSMWIDCPAPVWNWPHVDYAIIAEPVGPDEVWGIIHADGSVLALSSSSLETAECQSLVRYIRADLAGEGKL